MHMNAQENLNKLYRIISQVLMIRDSEINENTSPKTVPSWDSYNAIMLVSELERGFNVKFNMDEVVAVKNVRDIKQVLRKHKVEL